MRITKIYQKSIFIIFCLLINQIINAQKINKYDKKNDKKIKVNQILFAGVLLKNETKKQVWYVPNIFELFPANTIEGFVFNPKVTFTKNYDTDKFFSLTPNVRYGFSNQRLQIQLDYKYFYKPKNNGLLELSGGRFIEQLYHDNTLSAFNNTFYTFALKENLLKIYERSYIELKQSFSPVKNFFLTTSVSWNKRNPLKNLDKYELDTEFTSNNSKNIELENTAFTRNTAVLFDAQLRWQIGHQLIKKRGKLVSKGTKPAITVSYTNANSSVFGGDISFQKLAFSVTDEYKIGDNFGRIFLKAGDFLTKGNFTFLDFNHFKGKETVYGSYDINQFHLLEYYKNSTADFFIQGHYEHYFKPLSIFRDTIKFQPIITANYLYTKVGGHYNEIGLGFIKKNKPFRFGFYNSWRNGKYESFGLRVGASY